MAQIGDRETGSQSVVRRRSILPYELPRFEAQGVARRLGLRVESDAPTRHQQAHGKRADTRDEAIVEIEGSGDAKRGLVLDPGKSRRRSPAARRSRGTRPERSCTWVCAPESAQGEPECHGADDEGVDANCECKPPGNESCDQDECQSGRSEDS